MARPSRSLPTEGKPAKDLGPLRMIWREALKYPRQVSIALAALGAGWLPAWRAARVNPTAALRGD